MSHHTIDEVDRDLDFVGSLEPLHAGCLELRLAANVSRLTCPLAGLPPSLVHRQHFEDEIY